MLTEARIRLYRPRDRTYRVALRDGLTIEVRPNGRRYWRWRYRFAGKAKMLYLSNHANVSVAKARKLLHEAAPCWTKGSPPKRQAPSAKWAMPPGLRRTTPYWLASSL